MKIRIQTRYLYTILYYITVLCHTHTRKIRTKTENQFRSPWTLAAEDTWMLKGVLINADCSAVMWDIKSFIKIPDIWMPVPDTFHKMLAIYYTHIFVIFAHWNWTIKFFIHGFAFIIVYFVVPYNYNSFVWNAVDQHFHLMPYFVSYYFRNAVDQHLTLYLLRQLLMSGILLISIVMIKFCYDMAAAFHKPCGNTGRPPYIKKGFLNYIASFSNTEGN